MGTHTHTPVTPEVPMLTTLTVGLEGTDHSLAAADWAAAEAARRGAALRLVHAWAPRPLDVPVAADAEVQRKWAEDVLKEGERRVTAAHPGLEVGTRLLSDDPVSALVAESARAGLLVLGSRGHGTLVGHLIGSVALRVLRQATGPVVLVRRPREDDAERPAATGEVVVGVPDADEAVVAPALDLAFEAAAVRGARLRVVRAWTIPPVFAWSAGSSYLAAEAGGLEELQEQRLADVVRPWRERYPRVEVVEDVELGSAAEVLLARSGSACLLVVGRHAAGEHGVRRIGSVTHAALHHAPCPVAVAARP
ncbi:universal stress protein [Streptomyces sp. NPDC001678]|uniref:universal stress protein n=1 Tax=Streptomyces sp. NPDC001678 TaxID=3364599 RepID=UPI0036D1868F